MKIKVAQFSVLACSLICSCAFAQQTQRMGNGSLPAPGTCPFGAVCRTGSGGTNDFPSAAPKSNELSDPVAQKIWTTAKQLDLTADQRAQLKESLKMESDQSPQIAKMVQDAKRRLANALANGQTFIDSEIEDLAAANSKKQEHELKLWARLYAVLLPEQQRRLLAMETPLSMATASHEIAYNQ